MDCRGDEPFPPPSTMFVLPFFYFYCTLLFLIFLRDDPVKLHTSVNMDWFWRDNESCFPLELSVSPRANASSVVDDFQHCENVVTKWATSQLNQESKEDKHTLRDLLFFLHIPRTGGRTYFHCFLKKLYSSQFECPRSYDKLRFNPSDKKQSSRVLLCEVVPMLVR
ncbi:hypothetical protein Cgig2_016230 [Carnegiea gigantea]|uniref:Uncharacterized protein n=1 Tax=Carnegiea gigantea TaxID=171969 RepID=A0A9Q1GSR0_9CARY|nr:hypothetical protein Cgig2_016230 [Carnegiea gigantea]